MSSDEPAQKLKGTPIALPGWWLDKAVACWKSLKAQKWSMQRLADDLTDVVQRELNGKRYPWDRKTVERFLDGETPTVELMEAFCKRFPKELIRPAFIAGTEAEARAIGALVDALHSQAAPEKLDRRRQLVEQREAIEQRVTDQSGPLESPAHARSEGVRRTKGGRRARGMD